MAIARVSWASALMEPYDMAPVEKRLKIDSTGSTSLIGIDGRVDLKVNKPRRVARFRFWSFTRSAYSRYTST